MAYIPKSALRKIEAQQKKRTMDMVRANTAATLEIAKIQVSARIHKEMMGDLPRRLQVGVTPQPVCNSYDVYFNGKKQNLCTVADVDKGYIVRYVRGVGRRATTQDTERLFGKVEIVPKGAKRDTRGLDGEDAGATDSSSSDPAST